MRASPRARVCIHQGSIAVSPRARHFLPASRASEGLAVYSVSSHPHECLRPPLTSSCIFFRALKLNADFISIELYLYCQLYIPSCTSEQLVYDYFYIMMVLEEDSIYVGRTIYMM